MPVPEGLCTACSATQYCAEHQPSMYPNNIGMTLREAELVILVDQVATERDALLVQRAELLAASMAALRELQEFMPTTAGDAITQLEAAIAKAEGKR